MKIIVALFAALALAGNAWAHEAPSGMVYENYCCSGVGPTGDCHHIPASGVQVLADGYQITLNPGDHPLVTKQHIFIVSFAETKYTPTDGDYHACLYPDENTLRCFYAPPKGY